MPYIDPTHARQKIDPKIAALNHYLLGVDGMKKYAFFLFLTSLFGALKKKIERSRPDGMRYFHFNHVFGAFDCGWRELWRRWGALTPQLHPRIIDWKECREEAGQHINENDAAKIYALVADIVECYDPEINTWVGEVNYTISEVANHLGNSKAATHQELLDIALAAANNIYFVHAGPYEDLAIAKNGDTQGFIHFNESFGSK